MRGSGKMKRYQYIPVQPQAKSAAPGPGSRPTDKRGLERIPSKFMEAMKHVAANPRPEQAASTQNSSAKPSANRWRSSFKPIGDQEGGEEEEEEAQEAKRSQDQTMASTEEDELYNPYDPVSSDSEVDGDTLQPPSSCNQENNMESQRLEDSGFKSRWDSQLPKSVKRPFDRDDPRADSIPMDNKGHISEHRLLEREIYDPHIEQLDRPGYGSVSRTQDYRVYSPDRAPEFHDRGQEMHEDERTRVPQHRREMAETVRLSPPPNLRHDFKRHLDHRDRSPDRIMPVTETTEDRRKLVVLDKIPVTCDLCEVELTNGQELEDHLNSRVHWGTLEHIQDNSHYDDLTIAFLQEVMLYKSRQVGRAIEDSALLALQENDHMTKVEVFHCAACDVFVSTSATSVQNHITSINHLSNTKEFEVQQRRSCLGKAGTIMRELEPQFEQFVKGENPF